MKNLMIALAFIVNASAALAQCDTVKNASVIDITSNGATVKWDRDTAAWSYWLTYTPTDTIFWYTVNCLDTFAILPTVKPGEDYLIEIITVCRDFVTSDTARLNFSNKSVNGIASAQTPSISLSPNPTTGLFKISGLNGLKIVFDMMGRVVYRGEGEMIDISGQPTGVYVVRVGDSVSKIVKE